jgi:broad specificity phosphatase PhoE
MSSLGIYHLREFRIMVQLSLLHHFFGERESNMETFFYLIRHGETEWNREKRLQGQRDIPLSPRGIQQAERCGLRMSQEPLDAIFSSDLQRAYNTAQHIAKAFSHSVSAHDELRERHYGRWEGLTRSDIERQYGESAGDGPYLTPIMQDTETHGIETLDSMKQRALCRIEEIASTHPQKRIAIVSHGGLLNAILHHISEGQLGTGITHLKNTSVSLISYIKSSDPKPKWNIYYINDTSHLTNDLAD